MIERTPQRDGILERGLGRGVGHAVELIHCGQVCGTGVETGLLGGRPAIQHLAPRRKLVLGFEAAYGVDTGRCDGLPFVHVQKRCDRRALRGTVSGSGCSGSGPTESAKESRSAACHLVDTTDGNFSGSDARWRREAGRTVT